MIEHYQIKLPPFSRGFHLITNFVLNEIKHPPKQALLHIFIKHTSAGLTINENADPTVLQDFESSFNHLVKENEPFYKHTLEGSDDMPAHIKSTIVGSSVSVPIVNSQLEFGIWQGIYLCEFRNRASGRELVVTVYA